MLIESSTAILRFLHHKLLLVLIIIVISHGCYDICIFVHIIHILLFIEQLLTFLLLIKRVLRFYELSRRRQFHHQRRIRPRILRDLLLLKMCHTIVNIILLRNLIVPANLNKRIWTILCPFNSLWSEQFCPLKAKWI